LGLPRLLIALLPRPRCFTKLLAVEFNRGDKIKISTKNFD
jgi:hypothetical protein